MPELNLTQNLIPSGQLIGTLTVGSGTTDYNALENKPSINSVTLSGNKTASDLGLVASNAISAVGLSGNYSDLLNIPVMVQLINLGYNTTLTSITSENYGDVLNSSTTVEIPAGSYLYMILVNAYWDSDSYNFFGRLRIDTTNYSSNSTYAKSQDNGICVFFGDVNNLTSGSHQLNFQARVNGTKTVNIPAYAAVTCVLFRK